MSRRRIRIGVDLMGGDSAPVNELLAVADAERQLPEEVELVLIGHAERVKEAVQRLKFRLPRYPFVHAEEVITMQDDPTLAVRSKPASSLVLGMQLQREGELDAFVTAGNTGAVLTAATLLLGRITGVKRPTIATLVPTEQTRPAVLLDVGANVECRPRHLYEFAVMGSVYAREMLGVESPRVGLLNVGEEAGKGGRTLRETYQLLKQSWLNFIGNVEGRDVLRGVADVFVCDGIVGNIVLKFGESLAAAFRARLQGLARGSLWRRMLFWLLRPALRRAFREFDYQHYGGVPILGVRGTVIVGHGRSTPLALRNMLVRAQEAVRRSLVQRLETAMQLSAVSAS